jgi:hypothetical protein
VTELTRSLTLASLVKLLDVPRFVQVLSTSQTLPPWAPRPAALAVQPGHSTVDSTTLADWFWRGIMAGRVLFAILGQSLLPGMIGILARHLGLEMVGPALLAATLVLLVLYEIFMALNPQEARLRGHRRMAVSPAPLVAHLGVDHRQKTPRLSIWRRT